MSFQVSPLGLRDKVALFHPRIDDVWRTQTTPSDSEAFLQREVTSVLSTENGHFLLVVQDDELVTIRDVCRNHACEFAGIYDRAEIPAAIQRHIERLLTRRPRTRLSNL